VLDFNLPEIPRVDAIDKVRGLTAYGADDARADLAHAALTTATINRGSIRKLDTSVAHAIPGVLLILTHDDLRHIEPAGFIMGGGFAFQKFQPMRSVDIAYFGQPIALVVATSYEIAMEAASKISATYHAEDFSVLLDAALEKDYIDQVDTPLPQPMFSDVQAGDADAAYASAPERVDATYTSPAQHQNPMELIATVAEWHDGRLIVHEGTQNAGGLRAGLAKQLHIKPDQIDIISPFVGGGFGQKNSLQMQTVFAAIAARELKRPVKIVVPRTQIFQDAAFRPASRQRIRLGADRSGKMLAAIHDAEAQTSRHDFFPSQYAATTSQLYGIENFRGHEVLVRMDTQTPGYMRAPHEHVACFAMESAVDELAYRLDIDPVELRLINDTTIDPISKLPLSSRHVAECLRRGADLFGWPKRNKVPGSMKRGDGSLVGWGVAIGVYPGLTAPAVARLRVTRSGDVSISVGVHEMGQGVRTALASIVASRLKVPAQSVIAEIGDTRGAPQHLTAGSWGTATAIPAASAAVDAMVAELKKLSPDFDTQTPAQVLAASGRDDLAVEIRQKGPGQPDAIFDQLESGGIAAAGPLYPKFATYSYVAHFVEVYVETTTRRVRVPRVVSVADCGRVVSPRTARSQVQGAVVWGIGAALREVSEVDARFGGFLNSNIADYVICVNADIGTIDVDFVNIPDPEANSVGVKSLGEVAMTGVAPAITSAIYHATGRRLRDLPVRIESLL